MHYLALKLEKEINRGCVGNNFSLPLWKSAVVFFCSLGRKENEPVIKLDVFFLPLEIAKVCTCPCKL